MLCVLLGACKAYSGSDRNMPCGKRPSILQHRHPETLWGGEVHFFSPSSCVYYSGPSDCYGPTCAQVLVLKCCTSPCRYLL